MNAIVRDVMSTHVYAVREGAPFKQIATMLHQLNVSAFPVVDLDGRVIGLVSESDLLPKEALGGTVPGALRSLGHPGERAKVTAVTAADLMTRPAVTVGPDTSVTEAARLMYSRKVKRLPVTAEDGKLVGIVTRADVLSVYSRSDTEIQHEISHDLILDTFLCDPTRLTVTVTNGVVTIEGRPLSTSAGKDIIDSARHVEGVVAVRDRLSYPSDLPDNPGPLF